MTDTLAGRERDNQADSVRERLARRIVVCWPRQARCPPQSHTGPLGRYLAAASCASRPETQRAICPPVCCPRQEGGGEGWREAWARSGGRGAERETARSEAQATKRNVLNNPFFALDTPVVPRPKGGPFRNTRFKRRLSTAKALIFAQIGPRAHFTRGVRLFLAPPAQKEAHSSRKMSSRAEVGGNERFRC